MVHHFIPSKCIFNFFFVFLIFKTTFHRLEGKSLMCSLTKPFPATCHPGSVVPVPSGFGTSWPWNSAENLELNCSFPRWPPGSRFMFWANHEHLERPFHSHCHLCPGGLGPSVPTSRKETRSWWSLSSWQVGVYMLASHGKLKRSTVVSHIARKHHSLGSRRNFHTNPKRPLSPSLRETIYGRVTSDHETRLPWSSILALGEIKRTPMCLRSSKGHWEGVLWKGPGY